LRFECEPPGDCAATAPPQRIEASASLSYTPLFCYRPPTRLRIVTISAISETMRLDRFR
jgi:hypothetical protein